MRSRWPHARSLQTEETPLCGPSIRSGCGQDVRPLNLDHDRAAAWQAKAKREVEGRQARAVGLIKEKEAQKARKRAEREAAVILQVRKDELLDKAQDLARQKEVETKKHQRCARDVL